MEEITDDLSPALDLDALMSRVRNLVNRASSTAQDDHRSGADGRREGSGDERDLYLMQAQFNQALLRCVILLAGKVRELVEALEAMEGRLDPASVPHPKPQPVRSHSAPANNAEGKVTASSGVRAAKGKPNLRKARVRKR